MSKFTATPLCSIRGCTDAGPLLIVNEWWKGFVRVCSDHQSIGVAQVRSVKTHQVSIGRDETGEQETRLRRAGYRKPSEL